MPETTNPRRRGGEAGEQQGGEAVKQVVAQRDKGRWWMSWRIVMAVVVLAVIGRISRVMGV